MSQKTYQRLIAALEEHMMDEGSMLTDWYLVAAGMKPSEWGTSTYLHLCSESPFHTLYGLASMTTQKLDEARLGRK